MVEALIAFVAAVLILVVFSGPLWAVKLGAFGGLAFVIWLAILVIQWLIGRLK